MLQICNHIKTALINFSMLGLLPQPNSLSIKCDHILKWAYLLTGVAMNNGIKLGYSNSSPSSGIHDKEKFLNLIELFRILKCSKILILQGKY